MTPAALGVMRPDRRRASPVGRIGWPLAKSRSHHMSKSYTDLMREARATVREVSPAEAAAAAQNGATIIDVREDSEWEQGYVAGASHISKSYIEQEIEAVQPDRDAPIVLYCAGGIRSLFAAQTLIDMGYTDAVSMSGGFQAWKSEGRPTDSPSS